MTVKQLIKTLKEIKNKERELQILVGDEDRDYFASEQFSIMHTDDVEQCVEIFINKIDIYDV